MNIHFICTGNAFRSRLAESYLNSITTTRIRAISSGISASKNDNGIITWYAQRIVQRENLVNHTSPIWQETTEELLRKGDVTVFMEPKHLEFCREKFSFSNKHEVWFINDLEDYNILKTPFDFTEDLRAIKVTEMTFAAIKEKVNILLKSY